nr:hypothetical protein [Tanacetum cinerariifolium]
MTEDCSQLINFVQKFLGTVKFRNDHVAKIMGYGDYKIGNVTILRVYFMEGLGHNLFSVGQFCDSDLEVAFRQHTCFIRNLDGLVRGLPKLKFEKDHLCSVCAMGKSKKKSHKPKSEDTNKEKLYLMHMDLCGPMRVESVNGKKYILIIVDDYSRFTWVKFLRSKDEAQDFIIKFLKMIQVRLQVGISHETSVARSPQQNGVVERRNRTLIEAARTIVDPQAPKVIALIFKVIPLVQAESTGSPSSTTVDQDAPSPSKSQTTPETQSSVIPQDVEEDNHDIEVAHMGNDPLFGVPIPEVTSAQSSSTRLCKKSSMSSNDLRLEAIRIFLAYAAYKNMVVYQMDVKAAFLNVDTPMVEKSKLNEDKERKAVNPSHYRGSAYRKVRTCSKKDLSILTWNRSSGSMMRSQLTDYGLGLNKIPMYCDNKSAISLCCNNVQHSRSKHIDIRYHFIKEQVENEVIKLYFVNMEYQLADLFTKALGREIIEFLINKMCMRTFTPETLKQLMDEINK